jgi:3-oxoacyl-[acyl-carrier protein] reductase
MAVPDSSGTSDRKVALVTGASRGIGRAIAIELARARYDVMINFAANQAAADQACEAALAAAGERARVETCQANVAEPDDRDKLLQKTRDQFGRLDLLVNNAGIAPDKRVDLLEATVASFDQVIAVNLRGPYFLTQAVARWMIEQRSSGEIDDYRPAIVNITSVSSYAASPERGDYCVSKAGLSMMTKLYAARLASEGINVYEIRPGVISTDMTAGVKGKYDQLIDADLTPIKRWGTPDDVGRAVAAIAGGAFPFSTGEVINVDGGFHVRRL